MEDIMVLCKKCGNKVPASSLKLDIDEKMVICPDCIKNKKIHKEIAQEVYGKPDAQKSTINKPEEERSAKISHKCSSCSYRFRIDTETKKPRNCPYCNARVMSF